MLKQIQNKLNLKPKNLSKTQKGQSLVEMAIITPLLIFFLLGIFEVGSAIRGYVVLVNVNREITRYAVRPGYMDFSTTDTTQASFENVKNWSFGALGEQLALDLDDVSGDTTIIVSHVVVDTGLPCKDIYDNPSACDCSAFASDPNYGYPEDDLILHPGISGQQFQTASFGPDSTSTGSRETRLDYQEIVTELAAKNNKFNCEVIKKGGSPSNNNVVITEIFYDQPHLFGFPFISNPLTDPVPLYTHTSMRLINGARGFTFENTGPVCMAYPITFGDSIFDDPGNPTVPQQIDAFEGDSPGNFGWITWNPGSSNNNANYVEEELRNPRLSLNDFTDAVDPNDHGLSIGDNVSTKPGVANSSGIDEQLQLLVGQEILVPVYDNNPGNGENSYYHVSHFAKIRVDQICLPRNGSKCDGENSKQIKATFLGYEDDVCAADSGGVPGNNPPDAVDDLTSTPENTPVVINVLGNDSDPESDPLTITQVDEVSSPFKGTIEITDGGTTVTYTPKNNDSGNYVFSYTIDDGNGGTDTAFVTVTVGNAPTPTPTDTPVATPTPTETLTPSPTPINTATATPSPTPAGPAISSLILVNADTNSDMGVLLDGMTVDLAMASKLSIRAETSPASVGSVAFQMTGDDNIDRTENIAPYALLGDSGGNYSAWEPDPGNYTLTVTPYSESNKGGTVGTPYTVNFTVIDSVPTATPTPVSITMEAEDMNLEDYNDENISAASGGKAIKVRDNRTGDAWFTFNGAAGAYNITVYYFDENDGESRFRLYVDDSKKDEWYATQDLGENAASSNNLVSRTKSNLSLSPGDEIRVTGKYDGGEYARVDKVVITPN